MGEGILGSYIGEIENGYIERKYNSIAMAKIDSGYRGIDHLNRLLNTTRDENCSTLN